MAGIEKLGICNLLSITLRVHGKGRERRVGFYNPLLCSQCSYLYSTSCLHRGRRKVAHISSSHQSPQVRIPDLGNTRKFPTNVNPLDGKEHKDKCQKDQLILGATMKTPIAHV